MFQAKILRNIISMYFFPRHSEETCKQYSRLKRCPKYTWWKMGTSRVSSRTPGSPAVSVPRNPVPDRAAQPPAGPRAASILAGTGAARGKRALPTGREGKTAPGGRDAFFFLNGFGIEMQTTDLQKTAEQGSEHTHESRSCQVGEATVRGVGWLWPGRPAGCPGGGGAAELSPPPFSAPWRGADSPISHVDASAAPGRLRAGERAGRASTAGATAAAGTRVSGQGCAEEAAQGAGSPSRRSWGAAGRRGGSPAPRAGKHGGHPGPWGPARLPGLEREWWMLPTSPPWQWGISGCPNLLSGPLAARGSGANAGRWSALPAASRAGAGRAPFPCGGERPPGRGWESGPQQLPARPGLLALE